MHLRLIFFSIILGIISGCVKPMLKSTPTPQVAKTPEPALPQTASISPAPAKQNELICKRPYEVRSLWITRPKTKGCQLWYSRYETESSIAWSDYATTYCEEVQSRVQGKLEAAGFKCQQETHDGNATSHSSPKAPTISNGPNLPTKEKH